MYRFLKNKSVEHGRGLQYIDSLFQVGILAFIILCTKELSESHVALFRPFHFNRILIGFQLSLLASV